MRVRHALLLFAATSVMAGCADRPGIVAPEDVPARSGGIETIGSDDLDGAVTDQESTFSTTDDTTTSRGIYTNGSGG